MVKGIFPPTAPIPHKQQDSGHHDMKMSWHGGDDPPCNEANHHHPSSSPNSSIKIALQGRCSPAWKTRSARQCQSCMQAGLSCPVLPFPPRSTGFDGLRRKAERGAAAGFQNRAHRLSGCSRCPLRNTRCAAFRRIGKQRTQQRIALRCV